MCRKFLSTILALTFLASQAIAMQDPGAPGQRAIETHCNEMMGTLGHDPAYLTKFYFADAPPAAKQAADKPLSNTVAMFVVAPTTSAEYNKVFGLTSGSPSNGSGSGDATVTAAQTHEIATIQSDLRTVLGLQHADVSLTDKTAPSAIKNSQASYLIMIGHNEQGWFRFLDGSRMLLDELVSSARPDQRLVLLSCGSEEQISDQSQAKAAGVSTDLTYADAFEIAKRVQNIIQTSHGDISLEQVKAKLRETTVAVQTKHKIGYFVMKAACFGGAVILVALVITAVDPCHGKKDCK